MSDGVTHSRTANVDAIDGRQFRDVLGNFPTSVVAVTTTDAEERPHGMIVGTFTSVSLDPPLVSFLADRSSTTLRTIRAAGRFCANALAGNQERLSRKLATGPAGQRFEGTTWQASPWAIPSLTESSRGSTARWSRSSRSVITCWSSGGSMTCASSR